MTFYGTHTAPKNRKTYYEFTAKLNENKEQFFQTYTKGIKKVSQTSQKLKKEKKKHKNP